MGHRDMNPPVRRVVRDSDYSWGTSAMMNLYSGTTCPYSHRCRIVLYEKQMDFQVIDVDLFNKPEDIAVINPYNRVPVLVDRDLVLYESNIITFSEGVSASMKPWREKMRSANFITGAAAFGNSMP